MPLIYILHENQVENVTGPNNNILSYTAPVLEIRITNW